MNIPPINLPADLPTNWTNGQIVSPSGTDVGLSQQHGYNYLNGAVNGAQSAVKMIRDFFAGSAMVGTSDLMNSAVTTAKLADKAVSTGKLGDKAVTTEKLADKAVTWSKLSDESRPIHQNILDNWYLADPINQRGKTTYAKGYTVDRWYLRSDASTASVTYAQAKLETGGIRITSPSVNGATAINQRMETPSDFFGKKMTVSVLITENTSNGPGFLGVWRSNAVGLNSDGAFQVTIPARATGLFTATGTFPADLGSYSGINSGIYFNGNVSINIKIAAIKLELGDQQTLAHQDASGNWVLNDPPPNKALELAKCQRYFYRFAFGSLMGFLLCTGSGDVPSCFLPLPVTMRATPVLSYFNSNAVWLLETDQGMYSVNLTIQSGRTVYNGVNGIYFEALINFVTTVPSSRYFGILTPMGNGAGLNISADL